MGMIKKWTVTIDGVSVIEATDWNTVGMILSMSGSDEYTEGKTVISGEALINSQRITIEKREVSCYHPEVTTMSSSSFGTDGVLKCRLCGDKVSLPSNEDWFQRLKDADT